MREPLHRFADIHYGKSPTEVLTMDSDVPIFGTGGRYGSATRPLFNGPAVIVARKGSLGNPHLALTPFWASDTTYAVVPKPGVNVRWLYYSLSLFDLTKLNEATGVPSINRDWLRRIELESATPDQQRRIAEILGTVDEVITQTEALIAKQQQVKAGLMHDLFTRGLTPDGQLRPTRAEAPNLYHETPLGWLPKEWSVDKVGNLLSGIDAGWSPDCIEAPPPEGEWGVLKVSAVTSGVFRANESKMLPAHLRPLPELEVKVGDVITARANGVAELVGITVQVQECPQRLMLSDKLLRLCPNQHAIGSFLAGVMAAHSTRRQIGGLMSGSSGQRNIGQSQIRSLLTVRPLIEEQRCMERVTRSIETELASEAAHLAKLRQLKQGLMQALLTPPSQGG